MKKIILFASIIALAACSSKPKETDASADASATMEAPAPTPEPEAQEGGNSAGKAKSAPMAEPNMDGGFPDVEGTERSGATCKNGGEERMVSVIDTREGPCGVVYTKGGRKKTVAYAVNDMSYCDKVYDNILGNLTNGGYDCGGAQPTSKAAPAAEAAEPEAEPAAEKSAE